MARSSPLAKSIVAALDRVATPVYLLDDERRLVFANAAFNTWIGVESESLVGQPLEYAPPSAEPRALRASGLAPPPEAFQANSSSGVIAILDAAGNFSRRSATFQPLLDAAGQATLLLVLVEPFGEGESERSLLAKGAGEAAQLHQRLLSQRLELGKQYLVSQLIGESLAVKQLRQQVQLAALAGSRTFIYGRPGSGREHLARTIHAASARWSSLPLLPVACDLMIAETLAGAVAPAQRPKGNLGQGSGPAAAVLLKDVDQLPRSAQGLLVEVLAKLPPETLVLSTSRRSLNRLVAKGKFLPALANQLATLTIPIPPLAKRASDVPLLAQYFLEEAAHGGKVPQGKVLSGFSPDALELLVAYHWPGEVAELRQMVLAAAEKATAAQVKLADLPERLTQAAHQRAYPPREEEPIDLDGLLTEIETELLGRAMRLTRGNKTKAAEWLGIHRARLIRRLVQLGLEVAPPVTDEEAIIFEPLPSANGEESPSASLPNDFIAKPSAKPRGKGKP